MMRGWMSKSDMGEYACMVQSPSREEEEDANAEGANYQLEMMRCLREVNVDNNTVGW